MTVSDLIDELAKYPGDYLVGADDCTIAVYDGEADDWSEPIAVIPAGL